MIKNIFDVVFAYGAMSFGIYNELNLCIKSYENRTFQLLSKQKEEKHSL